MVPRSLSARGAEARAGPLTPASGDSGQELLPSQSPDANQSINNRDHARGSSVHNVTGNRYWSKQRKSCTPGSTSGEEFCALLQK